MIVSHAKVNVTTAKQYHKALVRETGIPFRKIPHGSLDKQFCANDELSSHQVQVADICHNASTAWGVNGWRGATRANLLTVQQQLS